MRVTQLFFLCYQLNCHMGFTFTTIRCSLQLTQRNLTFGVRRSLATMNFVVCGCRFANNFFFKVTARGPLIYRWYYWNMFPVNFYASCYPAGGPKKSKFWKNKKNTWRYYHFTNVYHKRQSYDIWFFRYRVQQTKLFIILDCFLPFYPPNNPKN